MHRFLVLAPLTPIAFAAEPAWIPTRFFGSVPPSSVVAGRAVDSAGNTVVAGSTARAQLAVDGFIGRYPREGQDQFFYLTLKDSKVAAVVTDDSGNLYATGSTTSTYATTAAGGTGFAIDAENNAFTVSGSYDPTRVPITANAIQKEVVFRICGGTRDFPLPSSHQNVTKINPTGSRWAIRSGDRLGGYCIRQRRGSGGGRGRWREGTRSCGPPRWIGRPRYLAGGREGTPARQPASDRHHRDSVERQWTGGARVRSSHLAAAAARSAYQARNTNRSAHTDRTPANEPRREPVRAGSSGARI
jgi:hypothetical protein